MDRNTFETELKRDGYELKELSMAAGTINPDHTHPFDARLFVLSGKITLSHEGKPHTYGPGDFCSVDANTNHAEEVGAVDVVYLAGRRAVA
jgi:quercetin dioxygenase-like cupin family protein